MSELADSIRAQRERQTSRSAERMSPADLAASLRGQRPSEQEQGSSGVLHELSNVKDMALALPGGLFGLGKDVLETGANVARTVPTLALGQIQQARGQSMAETGRRLEEDAGGVGKLLFQPGMLTGEIKADPQATEGLGQYIPQSGKWSAVGEELFPFFGATGASLNKTGGRVVDAASATNPIGFAADVAQGRNPLEDIGDTQYAELWRKGELAPAALEDIANASLFLEGAGAATGRLGERAGVRAASLADDVARAEAPGAIAMGPAGSGSYGAVVPPTGATPAMVARAERAAAQAEALSTLEQGLAKSARLTGRAGDLPATMWKAPGILGSTGGGRFGLFRAGQAAGDLGERLIPFGAEGTRTGLMGYMGDRGLNSLITNLDRTPAGTALVDWVDQHPVQAARNMRQRMLGSAEVQNIDNQITDAQGRVAQGGRLATRNNKRAARSLGAELDDVERVPSLLASQDAQGLMDLFDNPQHMTEVTRVLFEDGAIAAPDPAMARDYLVATAITPENVTAFKIADQYRRGTIDPEAARWLDMANASLRDAARAPRQIRFLGDEGERTAPQPANKVAHIEQTRNAPMPSVVNRILKPARERIEQQQQAIGDAYDRMVEAEGRLLVPEATYRSPISQQVGDVVANVPESVLAPAERLAGRQGAADYAEGRAGSMFSGPTLDEVVDKARRSQEADRAAGLPVDENPDVAAILRRAEESKRAERVTPGDYAAGVRRGVYDQQGLTSARRRLDRSEVAAEDVLGDISTAAVPKVEGLFQGGVKDRPMSVPERARSVTEGLMGPEPKTAKARSAAVQQNLDNVKARVREGIELREADLAREAGQKFGYDVLPDLPFLPPVVRGALPNQHGSFDWWNDLTPQEQANFAGRYMARETTEARRLRAEQDYLYERRNPGRHLYADHEALANLRQSTPRDLRPALIGDQANFLDTNFMPSLDEYQLIEARHRQGFGAEASEMGRGGDVGAVGATEWWDDWTRIADEQKLAAEKKAALAGSARGQNRENANIEIDQLNPDDFVTWEQVAEGVEVPTLTRGEVEAALKGFDDETGKPLTDKQRKKMMAQALEEKRTQIHTEVERAVTEQVDRAFTANFNRLGIDPPWTMPRSEYLDLTSDISSYLDDLDAGGLVDDTAAAQYDALMPEGFEGDANQVYDQFIAHADDRGLNRHYDQTPDQIADRALADVMAKVSDAFEADAGQATPGRGAGFAALSGKEKALYRRLEAAADVTDATQVVADQRQRVSELRGQMKAGIREDVLRDEQRRLERDTQRYGVDPAKRYAAQRRSIENVAKSITKDQRRIGERQGELNLRRRELNAEVRKGDRLARALKKKELEARLSPEAVPARKADVMRARTRVADELRSVGERQGSTYLQLLADDIGQIDAYTLEGIDAEHLISGGTPGPGGVAKNRLSTLPYTGETGARKLKGRTEGQTDYSTRGQTVLEAKRVGDQVRNIGARSMLERHGVTAAEAMGRRSSRLRDLPDLNDLTGEALARQMDAEGWVPWDPNDLRGTVAPKNVTAETPFIPKAMWQATQKMFNESSDIMKAIEKWYDRRFMGQVKMFWLALSPRWLSANVVGNALMATIGGGVAPWDYAKQIRNARALMADEAPVEWETGNRAQRRLFEKRQKLVERGDALRAEGYDIPHRALNRGFTSEEIPYLRPQGGAEPKSPIRKLAQHSYNMNEYVDNASRSAIYLAKMDPRRQLFADWDAGKITTEQFKAQVKGTLGPEAALKQALRAAGDFSKLTSLEKQWVKRIWVFYPWYRHITKLAMSLPIYSPARTVWLLHLADVFGGDPDEAREAGAGSKHQAGLPKFAQGGIPLGGGTELSAGGLNPFAAGLDSPFYSPEGALGAVTPLAQWPAAVLFGKDLKHGMRDFSRSPGSGNLDEYGRPTGTPLWKDRDELSNYFQQQFPQGRLFQTATRQPILYYDTGEPMLSGGQPIEVDKPSGLSGAAMGLFGVPAKQTVDAEEIAGRTAKRKAEAAKKQKRYQSQRERAGV